MMQQYYYKSDLNDSLRIDGKLYNHLINTLKSKVGEEIIIFNGLQKAKYKIESISIGDLKVNKIEDISIVEKNYEISIGIGLLKKDKLEWLIQKVVEIGVDNIYLLNLTNNITKFNEIKVNKKIKRYNEIIKSAVMQSKGNTIPNIYYIDDLKGLNFKDFDNIFIAHEKVKDNVSQSIYKKAKEIERDSKSIILVGPEGGFTDHEVDYMESKNSCTVSLGKNILRAETAGIYSISILKTIMEESNENSSI